MLTNHGIFRSSQEHRSFCSTAPGIRRFGEASKETTEAGATTEFTSSQVQFDTFCGGIRASLAAAVRSSRKPSNGQQHAARPAGGYHAGMMVGDAESQVSQAADPVPFRLRIGVTGHRQLPEGIDWDERIADALRLKRHEPASRGGHSPGLVGYLLAGRGGRQAGRGGYPRPVRLIAGSPPPASQRRLPDRFQVRRIESRIYQTLRRASLVTYAPSFESRESAYEWAGLAMIGRSDLVIAVWDDLPSRGVGGTVISSTWLADAARPVVYVPTRSGEETQACIPMLRRAQPVAGGRRTGLLGR